MAATTSPGSGTSNGAGSAPRRAARQAARTNAGRAWRRILGLLVLAVVVIALLAFVASSVNSCARKTAQESTTPTSAATPVVANLETEPPPLVPVETPSFTRFEKEANEEWKHGNKGPWLAVVGLHGFKDVKAARHAVHQHVEVEAVKGLSNYLRTVGPKGMWVTNTGLKSNGYFTVSTRLKPGDRYLVWDTKLTSVPDDRQGEEAIRTACGNSIRQSSSSEVVDEPRRKQEGCGKPKSGQGRPETPEVKGSIGQKVAAHKSSPTPTGSTRGAAEDITRRQDENAGSNNPVPGGISNPSPPPSTPPVDEGEPPLKDGAVPPPD